MHVLVVEDDARLAEALARILEDNGYATDVVHDGEAGVQYGETGLYDVIILDVMLPKADGFTVAQNLRRAHVSTPILLLTARDAVSDKICGYDSGADDYMTKPFSPAELLAHLRALTRRQGDVVFETLTVGDLTLNLESMDLTCGDESIRLSQKEFAIARILLGSPGARPPAPATTTWRPTSRFCGRKWPTWDRRRRSRPSARWATGSPRGTRRPWAVPRNCASRPGSAPVHPSPRGAPPRMPRPAQEAPPHRAPRAMRPPCCGGCARSSSD